VLRIRICIYVASNYVLSLNKKLEQMLDGIMVKEVKWDV